MALPTAAEWGIRSGGNDLNGAGFKSIDGDSVNYAHQDAAQLSLTDLATAGAVSSLTSATGGFTVEMKGNFIYIAAGTNFTVGYYRITGFTSENQVELDRTPTPGGAGSDGEGKVGGSRATLEDAVLEAISGGDTIYIEGGATYTPSGAIDVAQAGDTTNGRCHLIGYTTTPGDECRDANRPIIEMAANGFIFTGAYWVVQNLKLNMDDAVGLRVSTNSVVVNVTVEKDINNSSSRAFYTAGVNNHLIDCEGYSIQSPVKGRGVEGTWNSVLFCEFYDVEEGMVLTFAGACVLFNVVRDCTTEGIDSDGNAQIIMFNTIDGNVDGVNFGTLLSGILLNNQITHNSSEGVLGGLSVFADYNNWHGNGTDVNGIVKGSNATANDPGYANEGGDNFSEVDDSDAFGMQRGVT